MSKLFFVKVGVAIIACAAWWHMGEISQQSNNYYYSCIGIVYYDKTWTNTVLTCFTNLIAEQPSLTQYERPMYRMKEICYHPLIIIWWFSFFDFKYLWLNLGFLLKKLTLYKRGLSNERVWWRKKTHYKRQDRNHTYIKCKYFFHMCNDVKGRAAYKSFPFKDIYFLQTVE